MKRILLLTLAAGIAATAASPGLARQGCGVGFHRGFHGRCVPNDGRRVVVAGPVIGVYYHDRGWWDGHRYWRHRERWHGGWRYR